MSTTTTTTTTAPAYVADLLSAPYNWTGHTAAELVAAGRMSAAEVAQAYRLRAGSEPALFHLVTAGREGYREQLAALDNFKAEVLAHLLA